MPWPKTCKSSLDVGCSEHVTKPIKKISPARNDSKIPRITAYQKFKAGQKGSDARRSRPSQRRRAPSTSEREGRPTTQQMGLFHQPVKRGGQDGGDLVPAISTSRWSWVTRQRRNFFGFNDTFHQFAAFITQFLIQSGKWLIQQQQTIFTHQRPRNGYTLFFPARKHRVGLCRKDSIFRIEDSSFNRAPADPLCVPARQTSCFLGTQVGKRSKSLKHHAQMTIRCF